jgi:TolA-binding protein
MIWALVILSTAIGAAETDPCAGLQDTALSQCRSNQQTLRQQDLERRLDQQLERQNELDKQQRDVQRELENIRQQNQDLRRQLENAVANPAPRAVATAASKNADVASWKAANPWFGSDYARTQYAMHYMKQLEQERPDLSGRPLLDALSAKVNEAFGTKAR